MNNPLHMPGYRINEYRLVVPISESLQEKVTHIRKKLYEKYKITFPFQIKPSLTVLTCHAYERMEPRLIERLQQVALGFQPFSISLQNYSAYPTHTIYIDVANKSPFNELVKALKPIHSLVKIPGHDPHYIKEPHLLIAQKLKPFQFISMWMECEHSQFTGRCLADGMILLKRSAANSRYEVVRRMEFMSLPAQVRQGELFSF
jgi:2'-5' RNA ligase